jgi:hypothetical protein
MTAFPISDEPSAKIGLGHEDQFLPPRLSGRCRLGQATFAEPSGNDEDALIRPLPPLRTQVKLPTWCTTTVG